MPKKRTTPKERSHGINDAKRSRSRAEYLADKRAERKAAGLCVHCPRPVAAGSTRCQRCIDADGRRARERRLCTASAVRSPVCEKHHKKLGAICKAKTQARKNACVCILCGKNSPRQGRALCDKCLEYGAAKARERRKERLFAGSCVRCGKCPRLESHKSLCETCYFKTVAHDALGSILRWEELRELLVDQGGVCVYSGRKLTIGLDAEIDHIRPVAGGGDLWDIGNLQWVHSMVNQMKWSFTEEEFLSVVADIFRHRQSI